MLARRILAELEQTKLSVRQRIAARRSECAAAAARAAAPLIWLDLGLFIWRRTPAALKFAPIAVAAICHLAGDRKSPRAARWRDAIGLGVRCWQLARCIQNEFGWWIAAAMC